MGASIRDSQWGFAVIEMVHLLALAVLGGALLVTGLRLWGFLFSEDRPGAAIRDLDGLIVASLLALVVSGVLLFASGPLRYYGNLAFRVKLVFIVSGLVATTLAEVVGSDVNGITGVRARAVKALALLSLTSWLGAGIAGRVIGVL